METEMKVSVNDGEIRKYAMEKLGLIEPGEMDEKKFETMLRQKLDDDPSSILEYVTENDIIEYARDEYELMTADDFASDWTNYVDDDDVEDYARNDLDMMTEDEAAEWAKSKLDQ
jgi:hypothetical protein